MRLGAALVAAFALSAVGCGASGAVAAVPIDLGHDACSHCRMTIITTATAAEIVAPGEEPRVFDDLGCLRDFVAAAPLPSDAVVFVADHRTGEWIDARRAVLTHTSLETPMGSGLVAHADAASRDQDPVTTGGASVSLGSLLR